MDFDPEEYLEDPRILVLRTMRYKARLGGGSDRISIQHAKGKLTARERLDALLDADTFQELEPFVAQEGDVEGRASEHYLGDGVITGYGQIDGRTVYVYAQDFTVYGGTLSEMQSHKICRVMDLAVRNGVPIIGLINSGGARIQEGVHALGGYAEIFPPQCPVFRRRAADQPHAWAVRRRGGLFTRPDRPGDHGRETVVYVHHRAGGDQNCNRRGDRCRGAGRGEGAHGADWHGPPGCCRTKPVPWPQPAASGLFPIQQHGKPALPASEDDPLRMDEELNRIMPLDPLEPYNMHEVIERVVDSRLVHRAPAGLGTQCHHRPGAHRRAQRGYRRPGAERDGWCDRYRRGR